MKTKYVLLTAFSVAAFTVGCKPTDSNVPPMETTNAPLTQLDRGAGDARDVVNPGSDYAYARRSEFAESMKAQIAALNSEMDQLAAKIESANDATKTEAKIKLQALKDKTAELNKKLDGVKDATESTWEDVKSGVKKGYDELKDSVNQARTWLSEKIAPKPSA